MSILVTAVAAAVIVMPIVAIIALVHCGWKSLCWALVLSVAVAGAAWLCRSVKERDWRDKQQLHIRCAVENFGDQYNRISELDDNALRHDYVTNFCDNACILLNYDCKFAPNTSNLVERYYADWDERIDKAKCTRHVARVTTAQELRYGFAADVLFVMENVKAGTVLTRDMLAHRDSVCEGVCGRYIHVRDLKSVLGRKVAFDLKRGSILLKTDLQK